MSERPRLFAAEAILLTAVVLPLSLAEEVWWYLVVTAVGLILGTCIEAGRCRPVLSARGVNLFVVAAFGWLIIEYSPILSVPEVMALSHFMILVCIGKWLAVRTLRDDAQVLVLSFLLLVVAAVVSGDLLFPVVAGIYLTVGMAAVLRLNLAREAAGVARRNRAIHLLPQAPEHFGKGIGRGWLVRPAATCGLVSVAIGVVVFLLVPRVGVGMFGRFQVRHHGFSTTGLTGALEFDTIGPIRQSNRSVMRVMLETEQGVPYEAPGPVYLRAVVLDHYACLTSHHSRRWRWERAELGNRVSHAYDLSRSGGGDVGVELLELRPDEVVGPVLVQHYFLESADTPYLFACYPPIEIRSNHIPEVTKWPGSQVLKLKQVPGKGFEYVVTSPRDATQVTDALDRERDPLEAPTCDVPDLPSNARQGINRLIGRETRVSGSLDDPAHREEFVRQLETYLRSGVFSYTLDPPQIPENVEPISAFLLDTRRGHCQHFASALALMCHLKGVPARVICGYLADEYNTVGDFYLVREKHAHAWVEVFIPGKDWVRFDPTPSRGARATRAGLWGMQILRYLDYFQFHWANLVVDYDSGARRGMFDAFGTWLKRPAQNERTLTGAVAAFVRELFGWRLQLNWRERLIYWVFSLLVVLLALLIGYVLFVVARWMIVTVWRVVTRRPAGMARVPEAEFYYRFCRRVARLGLRRRADQTAAEFAQELVTRFPALADAPRLVHAYYQVVFGGLSVSPPVRASIESFLRHLRNVDKTKIEKSQASG